MRSEIIGLQLKQLQDLFAQLCDGLRIGYIQVDGAFYCTMIKVIKLGSIDGETGLFGGYFIQQIDAIILELLREYRAE